MVIRSQTSCTSASRWLHRITVLPCSLRKMIRSFISLVTMGSIPFDGCAFAGAIWPEQSEDLAAGDGEVQVIQGAHFVAAPEVLVYFCEVLGVDRGGAGAGGGDSWYGRAGWRGGFSHRG